MEQQGKKISLDLNSLLVMCLRDNTKVETQLAPNDENVFVELDDEDIEDTLVGLLSERVKSTEGNKHWVLFVEENKQLKAEVENACWN